MGKAKSPALAAAEPRNNPPPAYTNRLEFLIRMGDLVFFFFALVICLLGLVLIGRPAVVFVEDTRRSQGPKRGTCQALVEAAPPPPFNLPRVARGQLLSDPWRLVRVLTLILWILFLVICVSNLSTPRENASASGLGPNTSRAPTLVDECVEAVLERMVVAKPGALVLGSGVAKSFCEANPA